ncbi:hypothetical protein REPUB_Repub11eG0121200 [Reevesia pubescens]
MMKLRLSGPGVCANFQRPISRCYSNSISSTSSASIEVGSSFVHLDNGPDSSLLRRELNWLLQDSLEPQHHSVILSHLESGNNENVDCGGCEHWRDLVLSVQEGVLIPRPETEMIIDFVEDVALKNSPELAQGFWADLGTGTGAIAIASARTLATHAHANGRVITTDLSPVVVAAAAFNVQRYGLQDVVEVRKGSWFEPLKDVQGKLAGVLSNPPYIPSGDISGLQAEVGQHEPKLALDGGISGTNDLLYLIDGAASMLKPGGFFAFEVQYLVFLQCQTSIMFQSFSFFEILLVISLCPYSSLQVEKVGFIKLFCRKGKIGREIRLICMISISCHNIFHE